MSENTTRISDLPENIKFQVQETPNENPTYKPINVHANPYGNPADPIVMAHPENIPRQQPQQTIPSRDIPIDTVSYQNDEAIQQNYIPKVKLSSDYIKDYENSMNEDLLKYEYKKRNEEYMDDLFTDIQLPIFAGILFFIFQMPLMESFFKRVFSFLPIKEADGNLNFLGMITKSCAFISVFLFFQKLTNYLVTF